MKSNKPVNLSELAATATLGELALADTRGKLKLTKLPPAKPQRNQLVYTSGRVRAARSNHAHKVG